MPADVAGPYYFAWCDLGVPFDYAHWVMDEMIFNFDITQDEGDFAILEIEIENPGSSGLLVPGRPLARWFAKDKNSIPTAMFHGRLIAIPSNLFGPTVKLTFRARPADYEQQRKDIALLLRYEGLPWWDEIFIDDSHKEDVEAILDARAKFWDTDRVDHQVRTTDVIIGEDGVVNFTGETIFNPDGSPDSPDGDLEIEIQGKPLIAIKVDMTVPWKQTFKGTIGLPDFYWRGNGAESVASSWPESGSQLSGGYEVASSSANVIKSKEPPMINYTWSYQNRKKEHRDGDVMSVNESYNGPAPINGAWTHYTEFVVGDPSTGTPASAAVEGKFTWIQYNEAASSTSMTLGYGADRERSEHITFEVRASLQAALHDPDDDELSDELELSGRSVSDGDPSPIGDAHAPSYFVTDRGIESIKYGILLAVARIKHASRAVEGRWGCDIDTAMDFSCRKNAKLVDPRIQGGSIEGKIKSYSIFGDGDSGVHAGRVVIGACIGKGDTVTESEGNPTYCEEDYCEHDYQFFEDQVIPIGYGDIGFGPTEIIPNDDGLVYPLTLDQVLVNLVAHHNEIVVDGGGGDGRNPFDQGGGSSESLTFPTDRAQQYEDALRASMEKTLAQASQHTSWLELELKSLEDQAFSTEATVPVSLLVLPRQYDMETP